MQHDTTRLVKSQECHAHGADSFLRALVADIENPTHIVVRTGSGVVECFAPHKVGVLGHAKKVGLHRLAATQRFQSVIEINIRRIKGVDLRADALHAHIGKESTKPSDGLPLGLGVENHSGLGRLSLHDGSGVIVNRRTGATAQQNHHD